MPAFGKTEAFVTRRARTVPFLLCALFLTGAATGARGVEPERPCRVLIVQSFGSGVPPFTTHSTAFESAIKHELGADVELDQVSLENARYSLPDLEEAFSEFLAKRLAKWQPDLVVAAGAPAAQFVAKHRDRLFPGAPVIYSWVDKRSLPPDATKNNATFVAQSLKLSGIVEDVLQLDPDTNNVVVVLGSTPLERHWASQFRRSIEPFAARIKFTFVNDLPFQQVTEMVSKLPPHSFVLLGMLVRDASGVTFNPDEVLKRLNAVSPVPVNGLFRYQVGRGIVGGRLYQDELTGVETARVAARILQGEQPSKIPALVIPASPPTYDWRELRRWGISESRLPPGSVVLFRQPTAWQRHWRTVVAAVAVIATQAVLIFALLLQRRLRRAAEAARAHAEAEAQQRRAELAHLSRVASLGELTATLAHELGQPLTAILSNAGAGRRFLARPEPDVSEVRDALADITVETQRARDIISRLRDMLRRDRPAESAPVGLNEVIRTVERLLRGERLRHEVTVELDLAEDLAPTVGDAIQLQQVVMNLMLNAFAAMDQPGPRDRRLCVRTRMAGDGARVEAEFEDCGPGIAADVADRLFEPFVTTKPDGLGMGLSICRTILDKHRGEIRGANNPAGGATFTLTLPASPTSRSRPAARGAVAV
jgi:signal transduction histidine kinase